MTLEIVPTPEDVTPDVPTPILKGKFAFYETPEGGIHLVAKIDGQEKEIHQEVPKMALKMFGGKGKLSKILGTDHG